MGILKSYNESKLIDSRFGPGQNPDSSLPQSIESKIDDTARIGKLLTQKQGLKFIANNAILEKEQIKNKLNKAAGGTLLQRVKNAAVDQLKSTAQLIGSTLAQVPVNGTGTHFVHKFRTDTYLQPGQQEDGITAFQNFFGRGGVEGAQAVIHGNDVEGKAPQNLHLELGETPVRDRSGHDQIPLKLKDKAPIKKYTQSKFYKDNRISTKYNLGFAVSGSINPSDEINLSDTVGRFPGEEVKEKKDLAVLRFQVIYPESDTREYIQFRSYITSFADNFSGNWNGGSYLGRGEGVYTYQGFDRGISLGFKIFAQSGQEMKPLYKKIQLLASTTAPTYSEDGFMRGTLVRMTVGGYLDKVPGFIESVNYTVNQDDQWDLGSAYTNGLSLPMSLDCSINFKPIHTFTPETGTRDRFIAKQLGVEPSQVESELFGPILSQDAINSGVPNNIADIRIPTKPTVEAEGDFDSWTDDMFSN